MEQNDRERGDNLDAAGSDDAFRTGGMSGSAGAANTPSFGDPAAGTPLSGSAGGSGYGTGPVGGSPLEETGEEERMEGMRNRVEEQLDQGIRTAADRMDAIAQRIDDVADERLTGEGWKGRAGGMAHNVADRMESTASYLRDRDASDFVGRLQDQVRERPLEMLLVGVATGWLVGKILR
jgi:ElaB/YqjD/DUF883 family membrane-anchored ribosome-binding protein